MMFKAYICSDDFLSDSRFVKIGSVAEAIARTLLANGSPNKFQAERDAWPFIHTGIVAEKLHAFSTANLTLLTEEDYGNGVVDFDELVKFGLWCKRFEFVEQFAPAPKVEAGDEHKDKLDEHKEKYKADPEYRARCDEKTAITDAAVKQRENSRREAGRYTLEEAVEFLVKNSEEDSVDAEETLKVIKKSVLKGDLRVYLPGIINPYQHEPLTQWRDPLDGIEYWHLEAYWDDLNKWLKISLPRAVCEFSAPTAPVAKVTPDVMQGSNEEENITKNWKLKIQAEAARHWLALVKSGCSPTRNSIKDDLAKWCRDEKNNIKTDGGIFPTGDYIYRHVIRRKIWTAPD